jgi:signal transduction histidine kinase
VKHPDSLGAQPAHSATRILADIAHLLEAEAGSTARVRRALQLLRQIVPSDCCALLEATSSHRRLTVEPEMGSDEESALVGLLAHCLADLSEEVGSISMPPPQIREEMGVRSYLVAPLIGLGCVNGLLFVGRGERDAFAEHDLSLVSIIAAQLAAYVMKLQLSARLEERLASLAGIASSLTINQPMQAILQDLAEQIVSATDAVACSLGLFDAGATDYRIEGAVGLPEGFATARETAWRAGAHLWVTQSALDRRPAVIRGVRQMILADPRCEPLHDLVRDVAWDVVMPVPMVFRDKQLGTLTCYYRDGAEPGEDDVAFLVAVTDLAAVAVENSRLFAVAREKAVLEERHRLARDLHYSVSQSLFGISLGASAARESLDANPDRASEAVDYVVKAARQSLATMHSLIFELRPDVLIEERLVATLRKLASLLQTRHGPVVKTSLGDEPDLPLEAKDVLYRVGQEAMHNAARHAHASRVALNLHVTGHEIVLEVIDDGIGFDPTATHAGHLGLRSMRERMMELGGTLAIESEPGSGTRIIANLPYQNQFSVASPAADKPIDTDTGPGDASDGAESGTGPTLTG